MTKLGDVIQVKDAEQLLGKRVKVTLSMLEPDNALTGLFVAFSNEGDAVIRDDDNVTWFCWPMLYVETA